MDAVGFGLEKFDAVGARRDKLALEFRGAAKEEDEEGSHHKFKTRTVLLALDTDAYVAGIPDSKFSSPLQLGGILAKTRQCQECVVKQYFRYQAGRSETAADRPLIRTVSDTFRDSGFKFKELIVSLMVLREFSNDASPAGTGQGGLQHVADNHRPR
jgi:hypothetical protein